MIKVPCVLGCCLGPKHGQHRGRDVGGRGLPENLEGRPVPAACLKGKVWTEALRSD